ncbi:Gfo/Idh/MocA family protein [Deinococcus yavapaiensis]|uniref:Putative dehydrogenase n=1 Tax=Deinococcus yavapaiensis KR-236 TaxID=694435 RepID=A0A318SBJ9_9DEIO|nr:Gfo/Idh/MocA family oxidoreductase [Deinococcus yavapaiensis]PYE53669.1 putative dehydrogenase [Deinococcus yavapaiensis KR-236]
MDTLNVGILGAGFIAGVVTPAINASRNARVTAVAARDAARAAEFASRHELARHHESYDALLNDPHVDAVYVTLPPALHAPWTLRALAAGKHVLCEKPFAHDAKDARAMNLAAREAGLVLMEAAMYRFHPQFERTQELLSEGVVGDVRVVRGSFFVDLAAFAPTDNFRWQGDMGGGALLDLGYYPVSAARTLLGREPIEVLGVASSTANGVDEAFHGALNFGESTWSSVDAAFAPPFWQGLEVVGTKGVLSLPRPFLPFEDEFLTIFVNGEAQSVRSANHYQRMVEHFADVILRGVPLRYGPEEAVAQMAVLDALGRSARQGSRVSLGEGHEARSNSVAREATLQEPEA